MPRLSPALSSLLTPALLLVLGAGCAGTAPVTDSSFLLATATNGWTSAGPSGGRSPSALPGEDVLRVRWRRLLTEPGNGYKQARLVGIRKLPRDLTLTVDLDAYWLERGVNALVISGDHRRSLVGTASLGWILTPSWDAMLAGSFGVTPYFEKRAEVVARLIYKFALLGGGR